MSVLGYQRLSHRRLTANAAITANATRAAAPPKLTSFSFLLIHRSFCLKQSHPNNSPPTRPPRWPAVSMRFDEFFTRRADSLALRDVAVIAHGRLRRSWTTQIPFMLL